MNITQSENCLYSTILYYDKNQTACMAWQISDQKTAYTTNMANTRTENCIYRKYGKYLIRKLHIQQIWQISDKKKLHIYDKFIRQLPKRKIASALTYSLTYSMQNLNSFFSFCCYILLTYQSVHTLICCCCFFVLFLEGGGGGEGEERKMHKCHFQQFFSSSLYCFYIVHCLSTPTWTHCASHFQCLLGYLTVFIIQ